MVGCFGATPIQRRIADEEVVAIAVALQPVLEILVGGAHLRLEDRELAQVRLEIDEEEDDEAEAQHRQQHHAEPSQDE